MINWVFCVELLCAHITVKQCECEYLSFTVYSTYNVWF